MGLSIRLGAYFQVYTLGHTSCPLACLCVTSWVHLGVPECPKTAQKTCFLVAPDDFFLKNGFIDMVRGLCSSLNIGTYILPTCGPLCYFLGLFGGAQIPQNSIKNYFRVIWYYFYYKKEPNDLVRGLFSCLDVGTYIPPTCGPLCTFLDPFGGAQIPQSGIEKRYSSKVSS
jgi:hypothetical protein